MASDPTFVKQRAPTLYGIVAFKLLRGVLLLILAMKAYALVGEELRPHFDEAVLWLKLAGFQAGSENLWQVSQVVGKPAAAWFGLVVRS